MRDGSIRPESAVPVIRDKPGERRRAGSARSPAYSDAGTRWLTSQRTTSKARPMPRLQPISFFSIGNSGSGGAFCSSRWRLGSGIAFLLASAGERWLYPGKKQPGNDQPDPDHETEQAQQVNGRQFADALLPQPPEVGQNADREER